MLSSSELQDPEAALQMLERQIASWPSWAKKEFTLKPRLGTSSRGRVAGTEGIVNSPNIRGALGRLAKYGGLIMEPWLRRIKDYSVQLWIGPAGDLHCQGIVEQILRPSGIYVGHRGVVNEAGEIRTGGPHDEALRGAAEAVGLAASSSGYVGPCGVDSFTFQDADGKEWLRPVVEFNARFTTSTVMLELLGRALGNVRVQAMCSRGPVAFCFLMDAPPECLDAGRDDLWVIPLGERGGSGVPALFLASSEKALDPIVFQGLRWKESVT